MTLQEFFIECESNRNPSAKGGSTIQERDDASKRRTYYRAAIAEYIGCRKMTRRVTEVREGIEYVFDFRHDECGRVFKIFKGSDLAEYEKYARCPGNLVIIVDVDDYPGCEEGEEKFGDDITILLSSGFSERLGQPGTVYAYHRGYLCEETCELSDGRSCWDSLISGPVCGLEIDEED